MSGQHTPGDWKAVASEGCPGFWSVEYHRDGERAGDIGYFTLNPEEVEANVHLIAAAPVLLNVTQRARQVVAEELACLIASHSLNGDVETLDDHVVDEVRDLQSLLADLDAAISKANPNNGIGEGE